MEKWWRKNGQTMKTHSRGTVKAVVVRVWKATRMLPYEGGAHGVSMVDTPKGKEECLVMFGKGLQVDTQVCTTKGTDHHHTQACFRIQALPHLHLGHLHCICLK